MALLIYMAMAKINMKLRFIIPTTGLGVALK
jgi:hypothetical protein